MLATKQIIIVEAAAVAESDETSKKRNLTLKIILPIIIVGIIVMIGIIKNNEEPAAEPTPTATSQLGEPAAEQPQGTENADFDLLATSIDLEQLKSYKLPIIIDFGADECIPCKEMAPVLKKLNEEWQGRVIVKFVDVWKYPEVAYDFPVSIIPTQIFFDAEGNPYVPSEKRMNEIPFNLYSLKDTKEHVFTAHEGGLTEDQIRTIFEDMGVAQ